MDQIEKNGTLNLNVISLSGGVKWKVLGLPKKPCTGVSNFDQFSQFSTFVIFT